MTTGYGYWPTLSLKVFCGVFGWHSAPTTMAFDGASFCGSCSRCGARVLQDSQGNWFAAHTTPPTGGDDAN